MDFLFNQIVGDGANLFVVIVAIIIGFAAGMLSDPQQVVELWSVPTLLHEAAR